MLLSRRNLIAGLAGGAAASSMRAAGKATAFALIGDRYHNSDYIRTALKRTIVREMGISVDFTDEVELLNEKTLDGYKLLIILRDGMIWPDGYPDETTNAGWLTSGRPKLVSEPPLPAASPQPAFWMKPEQGKAVRRFVEAGGGALLLHNVTHIGTTNADFRHVLGASYVGHPPVRTFKVRITNPKHPIARGVRDFVVTDEQHYMDYDKDPSFIFLETVNEEGLTYEKYGAKAPGGWAFDYERGRVCYMSPGHLLSVLWNPEYVKLQQNAVRWLLRQL